MDNILYNLKDNVAFATSILIICVTILGYFYLKNAYSYWARRGIKGPKPMPLIGNFGQLLFKDRKQLEKDWAKEYGKIYGIYFGTKPRLVVVDPEVMNQICIKDFDCFTDHEMSDLNNKYQKSFIFSLKGDHWKRVRALMSPTFTSGKIRRMFRFIDACVDDLIECINEQLPSDKEDKTALVDMKAAYNLFAMDAITTCCYGLRLERSTSSNSASNTTRNDFVEAAKGFSSVDISRILLAFTIPKPILKLIGFTVKPESALGPIVKKASGLIELRRRSKKKFDDYLQLLLDAKLEDTLELNEMDSEEDHHAGLTKESLLADQKKLAEEVETKQGERSKVILTDLEIISASAFLLSVGLDTTAILLTNTSYLLAFHQEIQNKLYEELTKIVEYDEEKVKYSFSYDALTSCRYLDSVISESLRLFTPVLALDRVANRDYFLEKYNIHLPKGSVVNLAFHALMNDPENWPEPEKFNPERFMPGNKEKIVPGSYCPFGIGPRHCIGMRFSLTEGKLALAKIMMRYRFEPAPNTEYPPDTSGHFVLLKITKPIVKVVPRF